MARIKKYAYLKDHVSLLSQPCNALSFMAYAEQIGWVDNPTMDEATRFRSQVEAINDFFTECEGHDFDFDWAAVLHDHDEREDGSIKKPHFHILIINTKSSQVKVFSILEYLAGHTSFCLRDEDDLHWDNTLRIPNMAKKEHISLFLYLTHESRQAIEGNKYKYDRSLVRGNMSADRKKALYDSYYVPSSGSSSGPSSNITVACLEKARELGRQGLSLDDWWYNDLDKVVSAKAQLRTSCEKEHAYGVQEYIQHFDYDHFDRLVIFINGGHGLGKTTISRKVLNQLCSKLYIIDAGKTGKFDNLQPSHDGVLINDTSVPDLLGFADQNPVSVYRRGSGNPVCLAKYVIFTFNGDFYQYAEDMGYTNSMNQNSVRAIHSRMFHCEVDPSTRKLRLISAPDRFEEADKVNRLARLYCDYEDAYNAEVDKYQELDKLDMTAVLRSLGRLPSVPDPVLSRPESLCHSCKWYNPAGYGKGSCSTCSDGSNFKSK